MRITCLSDRNFLFLQGPHGPFFYELSRLVQKAGCSVQKIGINQGDAYYWPDRSSYVAYTQNLSNWPEYLDRFVQEHSITDIVVYGDTRELHSVARQVTQAHDLLLHCFEEGYLRPYWITYERGGANGNSPLMEMSMEMIRETLSRPDAVQVDAPAQWGAMWHHTFFGSIYHANILFRNGAYPHFQSHRKEGVGREWALHCKRLLTYPWGLLKRSFQTKKLLKSGAPYHVALLQLGHDASVQDHSDITSMREFIEITVAGFTNGAPSHHHLAFKAHPLEDGREPIARIIKREAHKRGVEDRVWLIGGGKLGPLLDRSSSVVTVNSTAGQQALWRGLPLKVFGRSVYQKPEFVSDQSLAEFFQAPKTPDAVAYRQFRQFLLETSQIGGGYYTANGRRAAKRAAIDLLLSDSDIYINSRHKKVTMDVKLTVVSG